MVVDWDNTVSVDICSGDEFRLRSTATFYVVCLVFWVIEGIDCKIDHESYQ